MGLGFMPAFGFGATATILVGQEIGRGAPFKARRMATDVAILGSIFLFVLGLAEFVFAEPIALLYTNEINVYKLAAQLITVSAFYSYLTVCSIIMREDFGGSGIRRSCCGYRSF